MWRVKTGFMFSFWRGAMDYQKALGITIRDLRLQAKMNRDAFSEFLTRSYLGDVENGRVGISVETLTRISTRLGIKPHQLLLIAEARMANEDVSAHSAASHHSINALVKAGRTDPVSPEEAMGGVRLMRANETRNNVQRLKSEGFSKSDIVKALAIGKRTVDRYWISNPDEK